MNSLTTTTLLELTNQVLLNAAEQPVRQVAETVASKRASESVKRAVRDIMSLGSWSFARRVLPPSAWDNTERVAKHTLTEIESVWYDGVPLQFVDWQDHAHAVYTDGTPQFWTMVNYEDIILAPFPKDDTEAQAKVRVVGYTYPVPMVLDTDTPGLPGTFIDALVSRATGAFVLRHNADSTLANQFNNEFEVSLQSLRDRERGNPRRTGNMLYRPHQT